VIDDGRIIEQGSHDDLVARDGAYARLWSAFVTPASEQEPARSA
jgi:ABC-type transport system involved in cytochrome bd biosynthesis fused ATPase/permease subunit